MRIAQIAERDDSHSQRDEECGSKSSIKLLCDCHSLLLIVLHISVLIHLHIEYIQLVGHGALDQYRA